MTSAVRTRFGSTRGAATSRRGFSADGRACRFGVGFVVDAVALVFGALDFGGLSLATTRLRAASRRSGREAANSATTFDGASARHPAAPGSRRGSTACPGTIAGPSRPTASTTSNVPTMTGGNGALSVGGKAGRTFEPVSHGPHSATACSPASRNPTRNINERQSRWNMRPRTPRHKPALPGPVQDGAPWLTATQRTSRFRAKSARRTRALRLRFNGLTRS